MTYTDPGWDYEPDPPEREHDCCDECGSGSCPGSGSRGANACTYWYRRPRPVAAVCPIPDSEACTGMSPCDDCTSLSKWEPLEPYPAEEEPVGSPIFLPGGES